MGDAAGSYYHPRKISSLITDRAIDEVRPLKVIYIGAGVSGIVAAIEFLKAVPSLELVIYEKNPEIGGTWYENRYPGCACDVPSHSYQLSFESWTGWSQFYAGAPEILQYWQKVANKYDIRKHVRFNHKCLEAAWDEYSSKWMVKLQKIDALDQATVVEEADVLITGTGLLNEFKWPEIRGLHDFKGELLHTANWNDSFDPTDKHVAVIGAGSSGIQVVPALLPKVRSMDHYIRGKTWITSQFSDDVLKERSPDAEPTNFEYTQEEKKAWKADPAAYLTYRKALDFRLQSMYELTKGESSRHKSARVAYEKNMRDKLGAKPEIIEHLIPDFPPLCKRLTPGPGYLEALTAPQVNVVPQPIAYVDVDSVVTKDGTRRTVDAIICATGFQTSPGFGFPIYGLEGINLREKYARRPATYLGLCTNNFPNFFQSLGPNSFQGAGSLLAMIEYTHRYMAQILKKMAYSNVRTIQPKRRQVENFTNYCDEYFKDTVYSANCVSWYKSAAAGATPWERQNARITALWPGSGLHALRALEQVRFEDFEIDYEGNDFGWFGNGWTVAESNIGDDLDSLTWYMKSTAHVDEPLDRSKSHATGAVVG